MGPIGIDIGGTSTKVCCFANGEIAWERKSDPYARPPLDELTRIISEVIKGEHAAPIGLCVPGAFDTMRGVVGASANMPCLIGIDLKSWARSLAGDENTPVTVDTDVYSTAVSIWRERGAGTGRLCVIAIGTGVGMSILTDGERLALNGLSSGHLGQIDVTLDDEPVPTGPDGGTGGLEAYIGLAALRARYGEGLFNAIAEMDQKSPPLRALAKAIRIVHAIYRPDEIVLAGGIGLALKAASGTLAALVDGGRTNLAKPHCRIEFADNIFHAARGIARIAGGEGLRTSTRPA